MPAVLACVVPEDGMVVDRSMQFCSDVYFFDKGITVTGENVMLDCNGAVLNSWNGGRGVVVEHAVNVTVERCRIVNYNVGMVVRNGTRVFLDDNHLLRNKLGTRFAVVEQSATFNHDVSLERPFEVLESENNVISLTNKRAEGSFCGENFCNRPRSSISVFLLPSSSPPQMRSWLFGHLFGARRLREFVLEGLA